MNSTLGERGRYEAIKEVAAWTLLVMNHYRGHRGRYRRKEIQVPREGSTKYLITGCGGGSYSKIVALS